MMTRDGSGFPEPPGAGAAPEIAVALLTDASDRPYVFGVMAELMSRGKPWT
jgi:hypothetical protein